MKHFTRFLSLFLGAVMILTMAACGSKNTDTDTDTNTGEKKQLVAGISITPDRQKNCDFSDPYFLANQVIVVNPGSDIQGKADLTGKTIAVQTGTTAETYCLDNGYEILSFASNIDAQAALTSGKADAWVVDNEVAVKMAGEQNLTVLDEAMTSEPYALAFAKGSDLVDQVNQALSQLLQVHRGADFPGV